MMQRELGRHVNFAHVLVADALDETNEDGDEQSTVGNVAERLGIDPSRASRMVASAVRAGLANRIASQADGRRAHVELTNDGRAALAAVRRFRIRFFSRLTAQWSDHDCAEFAELLIKFTDPLREMPAAIGSGGPNRGRRSKPPRVQRWAGKSEERRESRR